VGDSIWPGHLQCLDPQLLGCSVGTTKALCVPESGGLQQGGTVQARLGVAVQYHPARRRASKAKREKGLSVRVAPFCFQCSEFFSTPDLTP
jgi:hypothetical protein